MEPASIIGLTGSVAGILDILARSLTGLFSLVNRYKQAALTIQLIASQLSAVRSSLSQLLEWIRLAPSDLESNEVLLGDLHTSISTCELLVTTLDSEIQEVYSHNNADPKIFRKLMLAFDTTGRERQMQLNHQVTALTLLLEAIKCRSAAEQEQNLCSRTHRQAMSDVEDDSISLQLSLESREPSVASELSRRSSLSSQILNDERQEDESHPFQSPEDRSPTSKRLPTSFRRYYPLRRKSFPGRFGKILARRNATRLSRELDTIDNITVTREIFVEKEPRAEIIGRNKHPRVLLLGVSGSGKTSIMKSFQLHHGDSTGTQSKVSSSLLILEACVERMLNVVGIMEEADITFALTETASHLQALPRLMFWLDSHPGSFPEALAYMKAVLMKGSTHICSSDGDVSTLIRLCSAITCLWKDPGVKRAFEYLSKSYVSKDSVFMFENISRLVMDEDTDHFALYNRTTGIWEKIFHFQDIDLSLFDVGGARSERRKWVHLIDSPTALVFTVDIASWTRGLYEHHDTNAMQESLDLFQAVTNARRYQHSTVILVFTECETLEGTLSIRPLTDFDADYEGGNDAARARQHIAEMFLRLVPEWHQNPHVVYTDFSLGLTLPAEKLLTEIRYICGYPVLERTVTI